MRSGRLHIAGFSTGPTPYAVKPWRALNPLRSWVRGRGSSAINCQVTRKPTATNQRDAPTLAGKRVAHNIAHVDSGNQAPRAACSRSGRPCRIKD